MPNRQLTEASDKENKALKRLNINYQLAIGLLNYIAIHTWPSLSFVVSSLAQFSIQPGITHWHEVKKVWKYLKQNKDLKLTLKIKYSNQLLDIYSNSTWGDNLQTKTSQSGYFWYLYGSLVSWKSSCQKNTTYSFTKAELNPSVNAVHEEPGSNLSYPISGKPKSIPLITI